MVNKLDDWTPFDWVHDKIEEIMDALLDIITGKR